MKHALSLALLVLWAACASPAQAAAPDAILRCDPAAYIKAVDGDAHRGQWAGYGSGFKECAIPLSAGSHKLEVCYDASVGGGGVPKLEVVCHGDRELTFDAQPGHTYRLKYTIAVDWKAWVEDVTESEAGLSYEEPPPKPKPVGSKKERETIVIFKASPDDLALGLQKGVIRGKWFDVDMFGTLKLTNFSSKGVPDGYHIFRAYGGDTFAFMGGQFMNGSILHIQQVAPCGDFPVRVFENIPAGKVLYVGNLTVKGGPGNFTAVYSDEFAEARAYIDSHYPNLAGRLEPVPFREAPTATVCLGYNYELSAEPR